MGCGFLQEQSQISREYSFLTNWPGLRNWTCPVLHFSIFLSGLLYPSFPSQQSQPCLPKQRHSSEKANIPFYFPPEHVSQRHVQPSFVRAESEHSKKTFCFLTPFFLQKADKFPHHIPHYKNGFLLWLAKVWDWRSDTFQPELIWSNLFS